MSSLSLPASPAALRLPGPVRVINFNAPELNQLAGVLARLGQLEALVRPYVNKQRAWERALSAAPGLGRIYATTFGRRRLPDARLPGLTREAGVLPDWCSAAIGRAPGLPEHWRHRWTNGLHRHVRAAVADEGARMDERSPSADRAGRLYAVVAYEGFALPAFEAARRLGLRCYLNYPVAHHRARRRIRAEELEREPAFASTWPGFDDWGPGHEERLDREIDMADAVLLGSRFAADSFVAEGVPAARLRIVPYGVDLEVFNPGPPADGAADRKAPGFQAIYAGQLTQRKGLSYLLRGYRQFRRADSSLVLVGGIVGDAAPLQPHAALFEHVPHQTRPALAERYRRAHVFVFPTLVEGMPLVVLEAMACGLPVIVTANGPAGIVRDGIDGFIIPERSAEAVREKLDLLYRDRDRCAAMGREAARRAREFTWAAYGEGVLRCLAEGRPAADGANA